jgi:hypothetical protein
MEILLYALIVAGLILAGWGLKYLRDRFKIPTESAQIAVEKVQDVYEDKLKDAIDKENEDEKKFTNP